MIPIDAMMEWYPGEVSDDRIEQHVRVLPIGRTATDPHIGKPVAGGRIRYKKNEVSGSQREMRRSIINMHLAIQGTGLASFRGKSNNVLMGHFCVWHEQVPLLSQQVNRHTYRVDLTEVGEYTYWGYVDYFVEGEIGEIAGYLNFVGLVGIRVRLL